MKQKNFVSLFFQSVVVLRLFVCNSKGLESEAVKFVSRRGSHELFTHNQSVGFSTMKIKSHFGPQGAIQTTFSIFLLILAAAVKKTIYMYMRMCGRDTFNAVKGIALATRNIMVRPSMSRSSCRGGSPVEFPKIQMRD